jgi:protein-tyrosine phosphatase
MVDLSWLTPELAIGGAFAPDDVESLVREHQIGAVIDLRAEARDDGRALADHGIALLHLPTRDLAAITQPMLAVGIAFAAFHLDARARVLIHCQHGIGRSPLLALCVLVARGLGPLAALELAKQRRACVSPAPQQYEAWAAWLVARGIEAPAFERFCAIAYGEPPRS